MNLQLWQSIKEHILTEFQHLVDITRQTGMVTLARDLETQRIPKLQEERFSIVVIGEFNHGKSTFVNALLKSSVLPAGITPTTATINHLVYSRTPYAKAVMQDGATHDVDPKDLQNWVTIEGKHNEEVDHVEIGWPAEFLKDRITLVDTPGVNDINEARAQITYQYIPRADLVLFLLDATQILKQSERAFLEQKLLRRSKDKLLFLIGKSDLLSADEKEQTLRYCRQHLSHVVPDPVLFLVSAKKMLSGELDQSGFAALQSHLDDYLSSQRGRVFLDNAIAEGLRLVGYIRQNLSIKQGSLKLSVEELETRVARVRSDLVGKQQKLLGLHDAIDAEAGALKAKMALDAEAFSSAFCAALPTQIERVAAKDIQLHLQGFLQDTIKGWAEQEGEELAGLLERLAEKIIQVTNENVAETMSLLQAELGGSQQPINLLQVDFVKYDVGVLALGALGTSIYLFVNTLVGGVLTVAAPLVGMLVHAWLSGQVKTQAKKQAPDIIKETMQVVQPRFIQLIEEVTVRLSDYVTSAGNTLYKSISEVLDRVLEERRTHGSEAVVREREIVEQLQQIDQIQANLEKWRDALWTSSDASINSKS